MQSEYLVYLYPKGDFYPDGKTRTYLPPVVTPCDDISILRQVIYKSQEYSLGELLILDPVDKKHPDDERRYHIAARWLPGSEIELQQLDAKYYYDAKSLYYLALKK